MTETQHSFHLGLKDRVFFDTHGYLGPFPLFDPASVDAFSESILSKKAQHPCLNGFYRGRKRRLADHAHVRVQQLVSTLTGKDGPLGRPTLWYKNTHLFVPEVAQTGLRPE